MYLQFDENTTVRPCKKKQKCDPSRAKGDHASQRHFALCLFTLWTSVGISGHLTWRSPNTSRKRNTKYSCGKNDTFETGQFLPISHKCPLRPFLCTTVVPMTFFGTCELSADRGHRNHSCSHKQFTSKPFWVPYKMTSHWLPLELHNTTWLAYCRLHSAEWCSRGINCYAKLI